jgi:hypothetical protein
MTNAIIMDLDLTTVRNYLFNFEFQDGINLVNINCLVDGCTMRSATNANIENRKYGDEMNSIMKDA